ncbi:hypothetical protein [Actinoplanes regularis]|uniref:hypothetical protein n=1 Tax=Actinoplanes regularis TaxID=52697 RepID=UPI00249FDCAA|nr:hypothetical protein [Actinoplanes regularis]GLW29069.1 hypothetical protein Areg01_20090 [Actinoplanes regularis]
MKRQITAGFLAAAVGVFGLSPAAYADTTTTLTATEVAAAVDAIVTATKAASVPGWTADVRFAGDDVQSKLSVDAPNGHASVSYNGQVQAYAVDHQGMYGVISNATQRAALKSIGRPGVRYVYEVDKSVDLGTPVSFAGSDTFSTISASKVSHDDGTTDYTGELDEQSTMTWRVDAAGVLTGVDLTDEFTFAFSYGPQAVTMPTAAQSISTSGLQRVTAAYQMPANLKNAANSAASAGRAKSGSRTTKVGAVRSQARKLAQRLGGADAGTDIVRVTNISNGVRIYGTNPYTKQKISYQVTVSSSKKVSVKKG